jgi:plastocyanin
VLQDIAFEPEQLGVKAGETVTWRFEDRGIPHDVVADDGSFKSDLKDSGTFQHTFDEAGTFGYRCTVHPGMNGSVKVT